MKSTPLTSHKFLTIKEAAKEFERSEQTIRRLVKQYAATKYVRLEKTPKGNAYLISQAFLADQYRAAVVADSPVEPALVELQTAVKEDNSLEEVAQLRAALAERDQTIQQLQHRLLEQNDVLNALTSQMNSQRIGHIEELLLRQNEQLGELQKRLPEPSEAPQIEAIVEQPKKTFWQRMFGK
ncbi:DNA-binding transcriptional regulator GbsR (MarR family) [Hymenobacter luteus]|uniref:DNA-binding transcriptional regulator GbsR (MarR family) n=2 Tax=Hymenobacter TaxID=89966 RepID=A0A7W9T4P1_9BACT|nr:MULTISPECIES: DNA-binding protein [Hymenobacter]MBB4603750.1 DNA-binding transcriptional regulator GbsR (MarR family) [Hymenobacter latericoloratus]MBB6061527.1 DNA-binding transcriptional regulator GbsR (MarR family) [Hymenobacter luteus]